MKRIILSCLSLLMLFSMLTPWKTSAKSKIKLNKTSITMYTGTKVKLKLKGTKKKCKWSVNKPQIISVSQKGIVKEKKTKIGAENEHGVTEVREITSNKLIFNILTPSGFQSLS